MTPDMVTIGNILQPHTQRIDLSERIMQNMEFHTACFVC